ncbi:uncharacterized protein LOC107417465 isoform X2 [Ziziphus jujuba]|uniref:Uncharacterized protein LOC107417465 isoform X2 n=1 Tax=Ziziphus jujuba TaxID=326968 RepID=A0ABM3IK54_ZIZJJ|nr:uncharacterized protein LOC107417465 isoform X2 [Ziziphus jujuba]
MNSTGNQTECLLPVPKAKSCKSDLAEPKQYLRIASVKTKDHCMHAISDHLWGVKIPCQYDQVLIYPVHVRNLASHISLFSKLVTKIIHIQIFLGIDMSIFYKKCSGGSLLIIKKQSIHIL